jgi:hypothetical protein
MIAIYINKYEDLPITYFDLSFNEDDNQMLRLGSVPFNEGFTNDDMINKATEIFENNFTEGVLTEIITI